MSRKLKVLVYMVVALTLVTITAAVMVAGPGVEVEADEVIEPELDPLEFVKRARGEAEFVVTRALIEANVELKKQPRSFQIAAVGDILIHSPVYRRAGINAAELDRGHDFRPMFEQVRGHFERADLSICHLEVPLTRDHSRLSGYPIFNGPFELADDLLWASFDTCSTASNHTMDRGLRGMRETLDILDEAGLRHVGSNRTEEESMEPRIYEVRGVRIGHISATYGLNGLPRHHEWVVDLLSDDRFEERAQATRDAGAEFVIASFHWGDEYVSRPNRQQRALARELLEAGTVDLIIGHHAHVVQPVEKIAGRYVLYGLGNFLSNQSPGCCGPGTQDGVIAVVDVVEDIDEGGWTTQVRFVPTWVDRSNYTIIDVAAGLADEELSSARHAVLRRSFNHTRSVLGEDYVESYQSAALATEGD